MKCTVVVHNADKCPEPWIVCSVVAGELWYWGSWGDQEQAEKAANELRQDRSNVEIVVVRKG